MNKKFKNSEIGFIPKTWSAPKIGDSFNIQQGKQLAAKFKIGDNLSPFLKTSNLNWGRLDFSILDKMKFSDSEKIKMTLRKDDVLVCEGGDIGRTAICENDLSGIFYQNHVHRLRPKEKNILPRYFMYWMHYAWQLTNLYLGAGNKTTIPNLSKAKLSGLHFAKPTEKEQFNISHVISTLQKAIEKQQQIIDTTQALKKSLLHELFTKGTKGEKLKETEIGIMPESWKMIKIGEIGEIVTGTTPKTAIPEFYTPAEYDFIAPFDIGKSCKVYDSQKKISAKGLSVIRELPKYSVLCVCIGSTIGKVGLTTKEKSATNQQINSIICDEAKINPLFVYYLLTFYNRLWAEAATPSPVPILSKGSFSKLEIPFTDDLKEQNDIAKALYVLESKVEFQQRKKSIYESLFKTLLHELMTGCILVDKIKFNEKQLTK